MFSMDSFIKVLLAISWLHVVSYAAPRAPRLSLAPEYTPTSYIINDVASGKYSFGYDISDPATGNSQYRHEQRHPNGTVTGNYGYIDPAGRPQLFRYIADENGYRVFPDYPAPIPVPVLQAVDTAQSAPEVTWTRPQRPKNKKKIITNVLNKLFN